MFRTIKIATLSALLGLGGLAALPTTADAQNFGVTVTVGHGGRHYVRPQPPRHRACTPNRALNKAARMGVRHARIRNMNRNVITVRGREHGERVLVTFARARGCPVIRVR